MQRHFAAALMACAATAVGLPAIAAEQAYPSRPIRFLVGFSPGGASDLTTRIIGQKLAELHAQPVIIDNRAGASGTIAAAIVAKAAPDGYTLLSGATSILAINPALSPNLAYHPAKDFRPVTHTVTMPQLLVAHPGVKAANLRELMALIKAQPGVLNYSSSGAGSSSHLAMELFKYMTGLNVVHVPFKGSGQSMPALLAGQVQLIFDPMPTSLPHVKSGKLRGLAISTAKRSPAIPELPTVSEAGVPGYESSLWYGVLVPARTPDAVVNTLNRSINEILKMPDVTQRFAALGAEAGGNSPAEFGKYIQDEMVKWDKVVKGAGIKAE